MSDIFISYASEDRIHAKRIAIALEKQGFTVWWDRAIPAGSRFDEVIDEAIRNAQSVIVLWSINSVRKDWVLEEAADGRDRGILVPVLLEDVTLPRGFRRIQAANLIGWDGSDNSIEFKRLLNDINNLVGAEIRDDNFSIEDEASFSQELIEHLIKFGRLFLRYWMRRGVLHGTILVLIGLFVGTLMTTPGGKKYIDNIYKSQKPVSPALSESLQSTLKKNEKEKTIFIYNATSRNGLASTVRDYLIEEGYDSEKIVVATKLGNDWLISHVFYNEEQLRDLAQEIAGDSKLFPKQHNARIQQISTAYSYEVRKNSSDIVIVLGIDALTPEIGSQHITDNLQVTENAIVDFNISVEDLYLVHLRELQGLQASLSPTEIKELFDRQIIEQEEDQVKLLELAALSFFEYDGAASVYYFSRALGGGSLIPPLDLYVQASINRIENHEQYEGSIGIILMRLAPEGSFQQSGLNVGDVIISVDGEIVNEPVEIYLNT